MIVKQHLHFVSNGSLKSVNEVFNNTLSGIIYVVLSLCGLEFYVLKPNSLENAHGIDCTIFFIMS